MIIPTPNIAIAACIPDALNRGSLSVLDQLLDPLAVDHALPPCMPPTAGGTKAYYAMFLAAFPDLTCTVEDTFTDGDRVVQRLTATATMLGSFMGLPPTGRKATW